LRISFENSEAIACGLEESNVVYITKVYFMKVIANFLTLVSCEKFECDSAENAVATASGFEEFNVVYITKVYL
jgi:predicted lipoprotein